MTDEAPYVPFAGTSWVRASTLGYPANSDACWLVLLAACDEIDRLSGMLAAGEETLVDAERLLADGLFLCANGERPPGAPRDNPQAETWDEWGGRCEAFLRHREGMSR